MIFLTSPSRMEAPYGYDQCSMDFRRTCGPATGASVGTGAPQPCDGTYVPWHYVNAVVDPRLFPYQTQYASWYKLDFNQ